MTEVMEGLVNNSQSDSVTIKDLLVAFESKGFGFIIMIFAIGSMIPLPPPVPTIISIPLLIFASQMMLGYDAPRINKKLESFSIERRNLVFIISKSSPYIRKIEVLLKRRFTFMFSPIMKRVIGFFILLFALFIFLPIPLSNFIPALGIAIISLGMIQEDGVVILIGIATGLVGMLICLVTFAFVIAKSTTVVKIYYQKILSMLALS